MNYQPLLETIANMIRGRLEMRRVELERLQRERHSAVSSGRQAQTESELLQLKRLESLNAQIASLGKALTNAAEGSQRELEQSTALTGAAWYVGALIPLDGSGKA